MELIICTGTSCVMLHDATQGIGPKQISIMLMTAKNEKWIMVCMFDVRE